MREKKIKVVYWEDDKELGSSEWTADQNISDFYLAISSIMNFKSFAKYKSWMVDIELSRQVKPRDELIKCLYEEIGELKEALRKRDS